MLKEVRCSLCGSDHYRVLYRAPRKVPEKKRIALVAESEPRMRERVVTCLICGLIYASPRRSARELLSRYRKSMDEGYVKEEAGRRLSARKVLSRLGRYKRNGRLLDVGSAAGFLLDEARKVGWKGEGVELCEWAVGYATRHHRLKISAGLLKEASFPHRMFDTVVMADTIEHVTDPKGTLVEIRRILKPDGILYVSTPNIGSWISRLLRSRWWGLQECHLTYFSTETLKRMLRVAGYEVVKVHSHQRVFTLRYLAERVKPHNRFLYRLFTLLLAVPFLTDRLIRIDLGDQVGILARRKRSLAFLPEMEVSRRRAPKRKMKVVVVLPAYNAAKTLKRTVDDIPKGAVDEILLVDDASRDRTVEVAKRLGLTIFQHKRNQGYGANQKTCYTKALARGAEIVVMVHPDYQYDPRAIAAMIEPIQRGQAHAVFGSRMLKGGALEGGMPLWKHNTNILLTAVANVVFGTFLSEIHSGFRAYSAYALRSIQFMRNSDNFVFDIEMTAQLMMQHLKIEEVPIRTRYFEEASVIRRWPAILYGFGILMTLLKFSLHKRGWLRFAQFE